MRQPGVLQSRRLSAHLIVVGAPATLPDFPPRTSPEQLRHPLTRLVCNAGGAANQESRARHPAARLLRLSSIMICLGREEIFFLVRTEIFFYC